MYANTTINCPEQHESSITDIYFLIKDNKKLVFTACREGIRAFSISDDKTLNK
jgi:hypothetical protein